MQRDATPPQGTHVVLLFMLRQHLPYRHQEAIPTVLNLKRLLHISASKGALDITMLTHGILKFGLDVAQVVHSCTRSRRIMSLPTRRPGTARDVGYGCCSRGISVGNSGGRGRTVGVATMRVQ
jgi:hypothetical protein